MKIIHSAPPMIAKPSTEGVRSVTRSPRGLKWKLTGLFLAASLAVLGVVGTYAYQFRGPLSTTPSDWGSYGDFVGGLLNPILAFCSFSALLVTVYFQARSLESTALALESANEQLRLSKQNAIYEAKRKDQETLKQDLHEMLKALHAELQTLFTSPVDFAPSFAMGYFFSQSAPSVGEEQIPRNGTSFTQNDHTAILDLVEYIVQLNMLLKQYKDMIGSNPVTHYYAMRYMTAARRLVKKGFLQEIMVEAVTDAAYGWNTFGAKT